MITEFFRLRAGLFSKKDLRINYSTFFFDETLHYHLNSFTKKGINTVRNHMLTSTKIPLKNLAFLNRFGISEFLLKAASFLAPFCMNLIN